MRKNGYASKTTLSDLAIIDKDDKSSLSVVLSGKVIDLVEARKLIEGQFPHTYIEKKNNDQLRFVIPLKTQTDSAEGPSTTDTVEKIVDLTHCRLGCHFTLEAKPHGSKYVPELVIRLDGNHDNESLLGRVVLDIIGRRIDPTKTNDPLKDYTYERAENGVGMVIRPNNEVCENHDQVIQYGMVMASHFKHRLHESPHHIHLSGIEMADKKEHTETEEEGKQTICLKLSGEERELRLAKMAIGKQDGLRTKLVPIEGTDKKTLNIYAKSSGMEDIVETLRRTHMSTGFNLPVTIGVGLFPEPYKAESAEKPILAYKPAVALMFNVPDTQYDPVLVHALSNYVASFTKTNITMRIPLVENPWGQGYLINISSPTALVTHESYADQGEALLRARQITERLRNLIEYEAPEQKPGLGNGR